MNDGITWKQLQAANLARIPYYRNKQGQLVHSELDGSDWSPAQWLQALTGEVGEYADWRKKFERGDMDEQQFRSEAGKELADIATYLSILAYQIGVDLDQAIVEKFNEVSDRVGAPIYFNRWVHYNKTEE